MMRWFIRHGLRIFLSLVVVVSFAAHTTGDLRLPLLDQLEYLAYDTRLSMTLPGGVDDRIVVVDVDEASLAAEGRWPWSREKIANLVDVLFDHYQIGVLGFDIVFTEPERSALLARAEKRLQRRDPEMLAKIRSLVEDTDPDGRLAASLKGRKVVLGYYFSGQGERAGQLPEPIDPFAALSILKPKVASGHGANLPVLQKSALTAGFFDNPLGDEDGIFRRSPLLAEFDGAHYASLSLAIAQAYLGGAFVADKNGESIAIGNKVIPVDKQVAALIPYRGPQFSFPYISATDVLNKNADISQLRGRIVIVGTTAPGLYDLRSTPVQKEYAGVEIHANLVAGILDGRFLHQPAFAEAAELVQLIAFGLVMALLVPLLSAGAATVVTILLLGLTSTANFALWIQYGMVLPLAPVVTLILLLFLFNTVYGFLIESNTRRQLSHRFGQYVPPELVDEMNREPGVYSLEGERRVMTVMFSDVRGFTSISERLDPQQLSDLMNALLTPMTRSIHRNRGTIDKYMGDAIMAFWGAPVPDERHAFHAISAAMSMQEELKVLRDEFAERDWPPVNMGVGLASGEMSVGNMGSEFRMAYTVMGDSVNLGSRVEGLTKTYGVNILVSELTAELAPEFAFREIDRVRVKGKERPVTLFEPLGRVEEIGPDLEASLKAHAQALEAYRTQDWDAAENGFQQLKNGADNVILYTLYLTRISQFRFQPPAPDWDGVFSYDFK